jgi:hypothetical protein
MARKSLQDTRGGLISRGKCEACKIDLGNRLDPYCWPCARLIERRYETARKERLAEAAERQGVRLLAD